MDWLKTPSTHSSPSKFVVPFVIEEQNSSTLYVPLDVAVVVWFEVAVPRATANPEILSPASAMPLDMGQYLPSVSLEGVNARSAPHRGGRDCASPSRPRSDGRQDRSASSARRSSRSGRGVRTPDTARSRRSA